jgi:hypothetical protein
MNHVESHKVLMQVRFIHLAEGVEDCFFCNFSVIMFPVFSRSEAESRDVLSRPAVEARTIMKFV